MDDRNWIGDVELSAGSQRRKRMNDGGGSGIEATSFIECEADDNKTDVVPPYMHPNLPAEESHTRSLLKGVTWRCLATLTTVIIAWFVTGEVAQAIQIGFVEFFAKLGIYYMHERVWAKIRI